MNREGIVSQRPLSKDLSDKDEAYGKSITSARQRKWGNSKNKAPDGNELGVLRAGKATVAGEQ